MTGLGAYAREQEPVSAFDSISWQDPMIFDFDSSDSDELRLKIRGRNYTFATPADFEFALSGRICVPAEKITALVDVSDERLLQEAEAIKQAEKRFSDALSGVLANIEEINDLLKETKLSTISQDNDWRTIISALMAVPAGFEQYKKVALVKYMQYMVSRQEIVKGLYHHRQIHKETPGKPAPKKPTGKSLGDTAIFETMAFAEPGKEGADYKRIPKGETLQVELEKNGTFGVRLARSACRIVNRGQLVFVDHEVIETPLREGKNRIGRDADADIVMDPSLRDISRQHLIVETDGSDLFRLTDVSSHGTWVEPGYVAGAGI